MTSAKFWMFVALAAVGVVIYSLFGDALQIKNLAARETELRSFQSQHPFAIYVVAWFTYVAVTGLSLPGATALTLVYGWFFGFSATLLLVSFASTTGATVAFLLSRYFFRAAIQRRFGERLSGFNESLEREGPFYLFTLRLIPAVPFFVINAVMGLTPIRVTTFWWVSQLGMLAGTAVYVYAGSRVPDLSTLAEQGVGAVFSPSQLLQFVIAFALLGAFPLVARFGLRLYKKQPVSDASEP